MKKSISIVSPLFILVAVAIGIVVLQDDNQLLDDVAATTSPHTFIFGNGDPTDYVQGDESFGNQDSLGVWQNIVNAYPNEMPNFEFIHSKIADRVAALEQEYGPNYGPLTDPSKHWQTIIGDVHQVNGETRFEVAASFGEDLAVGHGATHGAELHCVTELWKHVPGGQPVLLDRTVDDIFVDGQTHAEHPSPYANIGVIDDSELINGLTGDDIDDPSQFGN